MKTNNLRKNKLISATVALAFLFLQSNFLYAQNLPQGHTLVSGNVIYRYFGHNLYQMSSTDKSITDWQSMNVGSGYGWYIGQPNGSSISLNRVIGGDPSSIMGDLKSNGQVFLINPNGILFGRNSHVDVNGLVASTLDISNQDFLAGKYNFYKPHGKNGWIINQGNIHIFNGGYVVLLSSALNNMGVIEAKFGRVLLAAGEKMTLSLDDDNDISVVINEAVKHDVFGPNNQRIKDAIENTGAIAADGGKVMLTAKVLNGVFDYAVNNAGVIQANSLVDNQGNIELLADGGDIIASNGSVTSAKAGENGADGGKIIFNTNDNLIASPDAKVDTSGGLTGGYVKFVADQNLELQSSDIYTESSTGTPGQVVIDPYDLTIQSGGSPQDLDPSVIASMQSSSVFIEATHDIFINSAVDVSKTLGFSAGNNLNVNADVTTHGQDLTFVADADSDLAGNFTMANGTTIASNGGNIWVSSAGQATLANVNAGSGDAWITTTAPGAGILQANAAKLIANAVNFNSSGDIQGASGGLFNTSVNTVNANGYQLYLSNDKSVDLNDISTIGGLSVVSNGDISVNDLNSSNTITLNASGRIDRASGAGVAPTNLTAAFVHLTSGSGIGTSLAPMINSSFINAAVTGTGDLDFNSDAPLVFLNIISTANGNININTNDGLTIANSIFSNNNDINLNSNASINVGDIDAGNGNAHLTGSAILDISNPNEMIKANVLTLDAGYVGAFGTSNPYLQTSANTLNAHAGQNGLGLVDVQNNKGLTLNDVNNDNGDINILAAGDINVVNVYAKGNVSLTASNSDIAAGKIWADTPQSIVTLTADNILGGNGPANTITAQTLNISASGGIGASSPLDTNVANLGLVNLIGDVNITNERDLTLTSTSSPFAVWTWVGGNDSITATSLRLGKSIWDTGNLSLTATNGTITAAAGSSVTSEDLNLLATDGIDLEGANNVSGLTAHVTNAGDLNFNDASSGALNLNDVTTANGSITVNYQGNGATAGLNALNVQSLSNSGSNSINLIATGSGDVSIGSVSAGGTITVNAANNILSEVGGFLSANTVDLTAGNDIGESTTPVVTNSNFLNVDAGGDVYMDPNGVEIQHFTAGGSADLLANNDVILDTVTTGGNFTLEALTGNIELHGTTQSTGGGVVLKSDNGDIDSNGSGHVIADANSLFSVPNGTIGLTNPVDVAINGNLVLDIGGQVNLTSGYLTGTVNGTGTTIPIFLPSSFPSPLRPPGNVFFNGIRIWPSESSFALSQSMSGLLNRFTFPTAQKLALTQVNTFDVTTSASRSSTGGGLFLYHPLIQLDSDAFDQEFQLDKGAYDFIDGNIQKKNKEHN